MGENREGGPYSGRPVGAPQKESNQVNTPQNDISQECSLEDMPVFGEVCEPGREYIEALNNLSAETATQETATSSPNFTSDIKMGSIQDVSERMRFENRESNGNTANLDYMINTLKLKNYRSSNLSETEKKVKNGTLTQLDNENLYYRIDLGEIPERARRSLLPHTAELLKTISERVNDLMHRNGLPNKYRVRMHIGSAYRTRESQRVTARTNVNASRDERGSAHEYGNTFDIQYTKLDIVDTENRTTDTYSYQEIRGGDILTAYQGALSQALNQMDLEKPRGEERRYPRGLINVVKEGKVKRNRRGKVVLITPQVYHVSDNGVRGR